MATTPLFGLAEARFLVPPYFERRLYTMLPTLRKYSVILLAFSPSLRRKKKFSSIYVYFYTLLLRGVCQSEPFLSWYLHQAESSETMAQLPNHLPLPSTDRWEELKPTIEQLYLKDKKKLAEVVRLMKRDHGLDAV
jgi:hypothetical protein